jgi:Mce-associated membrane protein
MSRRPVPRSLRTAPKPSIPAQSAPSDSGPDAGRPAQPRPADARKPRRSRAGLAACAAAQAALALVVAVSLWAEHRAAATEEARRDGLKAATSAAAVILSYDYARIEADVAAAAARTTGPFRAEYRDTSRALIPVAKQYRAVVTASVTGSAVVSASPDELVALLFVDQETRSTRVTGTKSDQARVRLTVRREGPRWLVSRVEAL